MSHLQNPDTKQVTIQGFTMGVDYMVRYIDSSHLNLPEPSEIKKGMENLLDVIHLQMSTYQDNSQISYFNQQLPVNQPLIVDHDFGVVLQEAIRLHQMTEGGLNVTLGALIHLWGFGASKQPHYKPSLEEITEAKKHIGMDKIAFGIYQEQPVIAKTAAHLYLDLSSIAKGFGVDKLAGYLQSIGINDFMVEIGGEVFAKGKNLAGEPWRIGIEHPDMSQKHFVSIVALDNKALATSGSYKDFTQDENGEILAHIIHPVLHKPVTQKLVSLSVIADSTMTADGLATGLYALGEEKALEIAEKHNLPILMIRQANNGFEMKMTKAFEKFVCPDFG